MKQTTKGENMENKIVALGIAEEHETGGPLWFDLQEPSLLIDYLQRNVELDEPRQFTLKEFSKEEFTQLDDE